MVTLHSVAVVAETEDFYSAGWAAVLQQQVGYASVLRAESLEQLEDMLTRVTVHFIAVADNLLGRGGEQIIRRWCEQYPDMRVAVFSEVIEAREVLALIAAGARGIISRHADCSKLLDALQTISAGGIFVPAVENSDEQHGIAAGDGDAMTALTERQRQVIRLVSAGHQNKVIARQLGISPSTVKVHIHAAFRALGVHSRTAAMAALRPRSLEITSHH